ncbi:PhnD/SsuA/transferrin family substrate-binding protein [candidate division FCPU426 bacterium]|nr:PhnD/SsuA/transferrin family substrate-binding protein [candidate division FCPU426 bacterium]
MPVHKPRRRTLPSSPHRPLVWLTALSLLTVVAAPAMAADTHVGPAPDASRQEQPPEAPISLCLSKSGLKHYVHPRKAQEIFKALVDEYLMPRLKFPIVFRFYESDEKLFREFREGKADIGCSHLAMFLKEYDQGVLVPMIWFQQKTQDRWRDGDHYILIARKKNGLRSIRQLKGKRLGISHPSDRNKVGYLFFHAVRDFQLQDYFTVKNYDNARNSLMSLLYKHTDVVFETEYSLGAFRRLHPELSQEIDIIQRWPEKIADLPIFYRASVTAEERKKIEQIKEFFLKMHEDPGQQELLYLLGCDRTMPVTKKEEEDYRKWLKIYQAMGL